MKTIIEFGKIDYHNRGKKINLVTIEMELKETDKGPVFTASANVWNSEGSDIDMGGQCLQEIYDEFKDQIDKPDLFNIILLIHKDYHLNNMHEGTAAQESVIRQNELNGWKYNYTGARTILKAKGLLKDNGYEYGTAWLYEPIPEKTLEVIKKIIEKFNN